MLKIIAPLVRWTIRLARRCPLPGAGGLVGILENAGNAKRRIRGVAGYRKTTVVGTILGVLLVAALAAVALTNAKRPASGVEATGPDAAVTPTATQSPTPVADANPLHAAAAKGDQDEVKRLLATGVKADSRNADGQTPLHVAAANGRLEAARVLAGRQGLCEALDNEKRLPLHLAAANGHPELFEVVQYYWQANVADAGGNTALHLAAVAGQLESVRALVELKNGSTAIEPANHQGRTPLHVAAANGRQEVVALLLDKGAVVNSADDDGHTPLALALANGHKDVAALLTAKGGTKTPSPPPAATPRPVDGQTAPAKTPPAKTPAPKSRPAAGVASGLYLEAGGMELWEVGSFPKEKPVAVPASGGCMAAEPRRIVREGDSFVFEYSLRLDEGGYTTETARRWAPLFSAEFSHTVRGDLDATAWYDSWLMGTWGTRDMFVRPVPYHYFPFSAPIPSYLHRMDDPRVKDYFRLCDALARGVKTGILTGMAARADAMGGTADARALLDLAQRMANDAPQDPYTRLLLMNALEVVHDTAGLRKEIEASRTQFDTTPVLRSALWRAERTLRAYELTDAGRNGNDFIRSYYRDQTPTDVSTRFQMLSRVLNYDELVRPFPPESLGGIVSSGLYGVETGAKYHEVAALFFLLEGDRQGALEASVEDYHVGQLVSQNDTLGHQLTGHLVRTAATQGLEMTILNGCERADEIRDAWPRLEWLNVRQRPHTPESVADIVRNEAMLMAAAEEGSVSANCENDLAREAVVDTQFQLLRMGASARYCFLKNGQFPKAAGQFELLPDGAPPRDPFGKADAPLRFAEKPGALVCYSIGPDGTDGGGAISYDPSNGTKSAGDITLEVPRERKYPFPAGGVKASNKADLLRQFPNGLPEDDFARMWAKDGSRLHTALGVTDTFPPYVYSRGPDRESPADDDSDARKNGKPILPLITYDPTNGTDSKGDIWLAVPAPGANAVAGAVPANSR